MGLVAICVVLASVIGYLIGRLVGDFETYRIKRKVYDFYVADKATEKCTGMMLSELSKEASETMDNMFEAKKQLFEEVKDYD